MKNFMLIVAFALLANFSFAQSRAVESFYDAHSGDHAVVSLNISGSFLNFISEFSDDEDADAFKKVTGLKILTIENRNISKDKFKGLIQAVRKEGYDEWMMVKEGSKTEVLFLAKEKGDIITDLVMLVHGDDDYVVLELTGIIDPEKLEDGINIDIDGMEHLKKAKKKNR